MVLQGRVGSLRLGGKARMLEEQEFNTLLKDPAPRLACIEYFTNKLVSGRNGLGS